MSFITSLVILYSIFPSRLSDHYVFFKFWLIIFIQFPKSSSIFYDSNKFPVIIWCCRISKNYWIKKQNRNDFFKLWNSVIGIHHSSTILQHKQLMMEKSHTRGWRININLYNIKFIFMILKLFGVRKLVS